MADLDVQIGKRLQIARKALGYKSARSFARKHNIPESTYSQHETGKRSLNPTTMLTYCERLNINPGWLVTGQPVITQTPDVVTLTAVRQVLQDSINTLSDQQTKQTVSAVIENGLQQFHPKETATEKTELASA